MSRAIERGVHSQSKIILHKRGLRKTRRATSNLPKIGGEIQTTVRLRIVQVRRGKRTTPPSVKRERAVRLQRRRVNKRSHAAMKPVLTKDETPRRILGLRISEFHVSACTGGHAKCTFRPVSCQNRASAEFHGCPRVDAAGNIPCHPRFVVAITFSHPPIPVSSLQN